LLLGFNASENFLAPASPKFEQTHADYIEPIFSKGTSKRIYGELYKVIDSSDVILHILDARDPIGTMCQSVLDYISKEKAHKQVVLIINKCDLVPNWVTVSEYISSSIFAIILITRPDTFNILHLDTPL
jgi:nuclear GTP-binding protein